MHTMARKEKFIKQGFDKEYGSHNEIKAQNGKTLQQLH